LSPPQRRLSRAAGRAADGDTSSFRGAAAAGRREAAQGAVIDAAVRMFLDRGFQEVTVEEIAAAVGVSVRTFYRYFGSKEGVLLAFALRSSRFLPEAVRRRPDDETAYAALRAAATDWDDRTEADYAVWAGILTGVPDAARYVEAAVQPAFRKLVAEAVQTRLSAKARARGEAEILAAMVVGVLGAVSERALAENRDRRPLMIEALAALEAAIRQ
jgi:AcrR family transcriptional regulator